MGCTIRVTTSDYFYNKWKMCRSRYWGTSGGSLTSMTIVMYKKSGNESHRFRAGEKVTFDGGAYTVKILNIGEGYATIEVWKTSELAPPEPRTDRIKAQILSCYSDKLGYNVGDTARTSVTVKNIGDTGTIYVKTGFGYIDSSNMIFLTGSPRADQLFIRNGQFYTFSDSLKVDITDYYRQQGIGWAYLQQQMYIFFLAGHKPQYPYGDIVWDDEKHIKIYIEEPEGFTDPTSLDESILGDIPEIIEDAIPAFGGLGGLGGVIGDVWDEAKPDAKDVIEWVVDKFTPEPKEEEEPPDMMPFIYIGFAGLIGYLLIRSQ